MLSIGVIIACLGSLGAVLPSEDTFISDPVLAQYYYLPFPTVPDDKLRVEQSYYGDGKPWANQKCNINHCDHTKKQDRARRMCLSPNLPGELPLLPQQPPQRQPLPLQGQTDL